MSSVQRLRLALLGLILSLVGCQAASGRTLPLPTPVTAPTLAPLGAPSMTPAASTTLPATTRTPIPTSSATAPSRTVTPSPAPTLTPRPTITLTPAPLTFHFSRQAPALAFGLEQSHVLGPTIGVANILRRTRIPADPTAFTIDHSIRNDAGAFRGWRQYVGQALEQGQVAFVLETSVDDPPAVVATRARNLVLLHSTARPWLIIIGNELNLQRMATYPVETYYAQLRAAYDAVKTADPTVNVATDGESYWEGAPFEHPAADPNALDRLRALLRLFERDQWTPDIISLHVFDSVWAPGSANEVYSLVGRVRLYRELLARYRLPKPPAFVVGEFGLPVVEPLPADQQNKYNRLVVSEREQADVAFMAAVWSVAYDLRLNYFNAQDTPRFGLRRNEQGEIVEGVYGVWNRFGRQRLAFGALLRARVLLSGATSRILADGRNGIAAVCLSLSPTADLSSLGVLGGLGRPSQACITQTTTATPGRFVSDPFPPGVAFRVEDVLGKPVDEVARQGADGRIILDLPGAPAQKTGGPVRLLIITP